MSSYRSYRSQQRPALRAKAVPMPSPQDRVLDLARTWLAPTLVLGWLFRLVWQAAF